MIPKIIRGSFLSLCSDALALHEPTLEHLKARQMALGANAQADMASFLDDMLPTIESCVIGNGIAVVPIHGVMVKRSQVWCGWFDCGVRVGSDHWADVIDSLAERSDIDTIITDYDTGGGQVAGTERLGDAIWKARQAGKLTIACVNEFCASAGLWAASQCEHIVIPATGSIGSLGVYTLHFDDTKWLSEMGYEKTVVYRGSYKAVDERPIDADAKADLQRFIDGKYSSFIDAVARGRGLSAEEVTQRWGDSRLFTGIESVSNGLADEIGTLQDVLDSLQTGTRVRVSVDVLPADNDEESKAMKLNAQGQILDTAGKVVGNISELQIDAAGVTKHFAAQAGELIESAVKTAKDAAEETLKVTLADANKAAHTRLDELVDAVGAEKAIAAFKAGESVEKAKAGLADDLAAQLKAKDEEIAKLKASGGNGSSGPKFSPSDAGGAGDGKSAPAASGKSDDRDAEYAADFAKNGEGYPSLAAFAARKRYEERMAAK
jgi:signal peptide peptidase SppA